MTGDTQDQAARFTGVGPGRPEHRTDGEPERAPDVREQGIGQVTATTHSADETRRLGTALGAAAEPGTVFLLEGAFGVGKTVLVQGLARGLGVPGQVTSPSFVLMVEHRGRLTLYHVDLYRLDGRLDDEMLDALEDSIAAGGVCAIEWPEALPADFRRGATIVRLAALDDVTREVSVHSPDARLLEAARAVLGAS